MSRFNKTDLTELLVAAVGGLGGGRAFSINKKPLIKTIP